MASLLSNLVNILSEGIHRISLNFDTIKKDGKLVEVNVHIAFVFSNIQTLKVI